MVEVWGTRLTCAGLWSATPLSHPSRLDLRTCRGQASPYQPAISPEPVAHLAQHRLLPLLVDAALKEPAIDLRMGHSVRSLSQAPDGVSAAVDAACGSPASPSSSRDGGSSSSVSGGSVSGGGIYRLAGRYLVASDGARGSLRQQLGVGMGGPGAIQHLINIHFISPQVGRAVRRGRRAWASPRACPTARAAGHAELYTYLLRTLRRLPTESCHCSWGGCCGGGRACCTSCSTARP